MVSWLVDMYDVHLYNLLLTLDLYLFFWPNSFPSSGCKVQKEKKQQQKTSPTIMETLKYLVNKFLWRYLYSSVVNSPRNIAIFFPFLYCIHLPWPAGGRRAASSDSCLLLLLQVQLSLLGLFFQICIISQIILLSKSQLHRLSDIVAPVNKVSSCGLSHAWPCLFCLVFGGSVMFVLGLHGEVL